LESNQQNIPPWYVPGYNYFENQYPSKTMASKSDILDDFVQGLRMDFK
jgi:hypothetical protein